jgi:uncharacterized caspase-like protein
MKKVYLIFALLLSIFIFGVNTQAQNKFALCMGLSKCGTPNAPDIMAAQNDAIDLKKVLVRQGYNASVVTNQYATRQNILTRLRKIVAATKNSNDKILLYFATHGTEKGYILTYGGEYIQYSEIIDILSKSKTRHIYVFIMACHSGTVAAGLTEDPNWRNDIVRSGISFMVSSRPEETSKSVTLPHWKHSFFGQAVIKGMRGKADGNRDRSVTLKELYDYVYAEVVNRMDGRAEIGGEVQHPQLICQTSEYNAVLAKW